MQDLAELHRSSRPATFLSDLGKPKISSPKNQVTTWALKELDKNMANAGLWPLNLFVEFSWVWLCFHRTMWEWSLSSKERRGEIMFFNVVWVQISCCSLFTFRLLLCRILQFSRPVKLEHLQTKAKVAFGQTMDLHYTNNEVRGWKR